MAILNNAKLQKAKHSHSVLLSAFFVPFMKGFSFQNDSTSTTRTTTKLLLRPLSVASGQKITNGTKNILNICQQNLLQSRQKMEQKEQKMLANENRV